MKGRRVAAAVLAMLFLLAQRAWAVDISATAAVLMDADTGRILYEKNPDRRMLVASTTKILTALVVLESCELRSTVKVTQEHMTEGSSMYLKPGEEVTVECLLYCSLPPATMQPWRWQRPAAGWSHALGP